MSKSKSVLRLLRYIIGLNNLRQFFIQSEVKPKPILTLLARVFQRFASATCNRPFAAKPSRDLLFIKLWAATLRMPEMEKACRKHQNGKV